MAGANPERISHASEGGLDGAVCTQPPLHEPSLEGGRVTAAIELGNRDSTSGLLPLLVRHERGEGWGEGKVIKTALLSPALSSLPKGREGEELRGLLLYSA
jgi:hypothetical protein